MWNTMLLKINVTIYNTPRYMVFSPVMFLSCSCQERVIGKKKKGFITVIGSLAQAFRVR